MIFYPAIDLKNGKCVRLKQGMMDDATIFADDPAAQGAKFAAQGAEWLHIVDLDGAFSGKSENGAAVESIIKNCKIKLQLGGGIRTLENIEKWLNLGIARVILGTAALQNPALVKEACQKFPGKIAVGIDAKGGKVATSGWAEISQICAEELAKKFEDAGVTVIIYTNIDHDGMMAGPDIKSTKNLAENIAIPVIASGGVSCIEDLIELKKIEKFGLKGVIAGRAVYEGAIDVAEAIKVLQC